MAIFKEAEEQDQSEFNAAIAKLMLIKEVEKLLIISTLRHNYDEKYNALTAYFTSLISIMKNEDDELMKKRWRQITEAYYIYLGYKKNGKKPPLQIWEAFMDFEIELRNMEQKYGLALPKKSDPRWAMGNRR